MTRDMVYVKKVRPSENRPHGLFHVLISDVLRVAAREGQGFQDENCKQPGRKETCTSSIDYQTTIKPNSKKGAAAQDLRRQERHNPDDDRLDDGVEPANGLLPRRVRPGDQGW